MAGPHTAVSQLHGYMSSFPVVQWLEVGTRNAKVMGSNPRIAHTRIQMYCQMQCKV